MTTPLLIALSLTGIPPSLSTWTEMAAELEATGRVECRLREDEVALSRLTRDRVIKILSPYDFTGKHDPLICAVVAVSVNKAGYTTAINVLRYKGPGGAHETRVLNVARFKPQTEPWTAIVRFVLPPIADSAERKATADEWRAYEVQRAMTDAPAR